MAQDPISVTKAFQQHSRTKKDADLSAYNFGKLPPQALDLEEAVLGALMLDKNAVAAVGDILRKDAFYDARHQRIYECITELFGQSRPIDILTVTDELRNKGFLEEVGGAYYISSLANKVASAANIEFHARIVAQKYVQRELISISTEVIKDAYEDTTDVFELLDKAEREFFKITDETLGKGIENMNTLISKAVKQIETARDHEDELIGVPSGFTDLDRVTNGWQKSDLIVIAGRPAMGKTSFALNAARNAAVDFGKPVAIFSLEMSNIQLVNRLISSEAELPSEKLRSGGLEEHEWQQLTHKINKISDAPIFIDDTPAINIFDLKAKCRRLKMQEDIQLILIDYLQLMSGVKDGKNSNREQEISNISRALKGIAKELNVPVIALSQLNRSVETRGGDKRPMLSDLRESGAIEQDADMVIFLYRPEYYGLTEDADGNDTRGLAEVLIAKNRNGAVTTVRTKFIGKYAKFDNLEQNEFSLGPDTSSPPTDESGFKYLGSRANDLDDDTPF